MSKPFGFEKPLGMRDTLPSLHVTKEQLQKTILDEIKRCGYHLLETPTLEYYDTVGSATAIPEQQLFKLLDQQGRTLVLRPDMTAPIARITASTLKNEAYPLRLAYDANVFRAQRHEGGHPAEFEQVGIELIGDGSVSADAEVIALMAAVLKLAGLREFQVAVGHIGYVNTLLTDIVGDGQHVDQLRRLLYEKNIVGFRQLVRQISLSPANERRLLTLLELRGEREVLAQAETLIHSRPGKEMLSDLALLADILEDYDVSEHVKFDFTLVSHMDYYTGVVYEGYNGKLGFPLASGGRYDELLGRFHRPAPATGFGIFFDRLVEAVGVTAKEQKSCCVIYTPERRKEALALATAKRRRGERAVLQELAGIPDVKAFTQRFTKVVYCMDKGNKEVFE